MIRAFIALSLISASAAGIAAGLAPAKSAALNTAAPWWEKVTVTVPPGGEAPKCTFTSSNGGNEACDVETDGKTLAEAGPDKGQLTKITFERRFDPGATAPDNPPLSGGETLLGGQVLKLAIDGTDKVASCRVVAKAGDMEPDYGCKDAAAERFAAAASGSSERGGFMTVLVYAHNEQVA